LYLIPHDDKKEKGGEDSWFISNDLKTIGVFDGVGGWATAGIDPREYSHNLSLHCKKAVDEQSKTHPLQIMRYGYDRTQHIVGSSTACIIAIIENQFISANLGDSGFRIIRSGQVVLSSSSQQHSFNTPYQLGTQSDDLPELSEIQHFTLEPGDYIILGTDGLFDNLYDDDILTVLSHQSPHSTTETIAESIALKAYQVSKLNQVKIPFNDMAESYFGTPYWDNGKQDDITVLVLRYDVSPDV
jgi:protein phosphatase PTC7